MKREAVITEEETYFDDTLNGRRKTKKLNKSLSLLLREKNDEITSLTCQKVVLCHSQLDKKSGNERLIHRAFCRLWTESKKRKEPKELLSKQMKNHTKNDRN